MPTENRFHAAQNAGAPSSNLAGNGPQDGKNEFRQSPRNEEKRLSSTHTLMSPISSAPRAYPADASIVLVGIRGTGKSTLGVMAASALGYQLVDADRHFFRTTGLSRVAYKSKHGLEAYRCREIEATRSILIENSSRAVIVCGPGSVEDTVRSLFLDFAKTHPVIYVQRDIDEIQKHVGDCDSKTLSQLVEMTSPIYRTISTFEYYNLSEPSYSSPDHSIHTVNRVPTSLTLKEAEQDFLHFISNVKDHQLPNNVCLQQPELQDYSYALRLPLSQLPGIISRSAKFGLIGGRHRSCYRPSFNELWEEHVQSLDGQNHQHAILSDSEAFPLAHDI